MDKKVENDIETGSRAHACLFRVWGLGCGVSDVEFKA